MLTDWREQLNAIFQNKDLSQAVGRAVVEYQESDHRVVKRKYLRLAIWDGEGVFKDCYAWRLFSNEESLLGSEVRSVLDVAGVNIAAADLLVPRRMVYEASAEAAEENHSSTGFKIRDASADGRRRSLLYDPETVKRMQRMFSLSGVAISGLCPATEALKDYAVEEKSCLVVDDDGPVVRCALVAGGETVFSGEQSIEQNRFFQENLQEWVERLLVRYRAIDNKPADVIVCPRNSAVTEALQVFASKNEIEFKTFDPLDSTGVPPDVAKRLRSQKQSLGPLLASGGGLPLTLLDPDEEKFSLLFAVRKKAAVIAALMTVFILLTGACLGKLINNKTAVMNEMYQVEKIQKERITNLVLIRETIAELSLESDHGKSLLAVLDRFIAGLPGTTTFNLIDLREDYLEAEGVTTDVSATGSYFKNLAGKDYFGTVKAEVTRIETAGNKRVAYFTVHCRLKEERVTSQ